MTDGLAQESWQRAESLCREAKMSAAGGDLERARGLWARAIDVAREGERSESPQESIDCSSVLWEITEEMARAGELAEARRVAQGIRNAWKRSRALGAIEVIEKGREQ